MKRLVLASSSPRRIELMKLLGLEFEVIPSNYDEKLFTPHSPEKTAEVIALKKAEDVASREKGAIVIGSDTIVVLGDDILGKPKDEEDAERMLKALSGKEHEIMTGYAVVDSDTKRTVSGYSRAKVKMKQLLQKEINAYIKTGEPMDKAGSYAVQGIGGVFIEKVEGNVFDIIGLPLPALREALNKFNIRTLE